MALVPVVLTISMLLAIVASLPRISHAQCPDASYPDPGPAWTGPTTQDIPIPGTNCTELVTYCDRYNTTIPEWEMIITSVTPDVGDTCEDPEVLVIGAFDYFVNTGAGPEDIGLPLCDTGGSAIVHTYLLRCWKWSGNDQYGNQIYTACLNDISCAATCTECYNSNLRKNVITGCSKISGTYQGDCTAEPSNPLKWVEGTCYDMGNMCGPN